MRPRPVYLRRRARAWHSVQWRDGLTVGILGGFIAGTGLCNIIFRVFS